jgi:hypothetical protein
MSLKDPNVLNRDRRKRVAIVIANPAVSSTTGWPVGFWLSELTHPDNAVWSMNLLSRDKHVMPWRIEDELKRLGANYVQAGLWRGFAIRDGNLITGQQNLSGEETARLIVETLGR